MQVDMEQAMIYVAMIYEAVQCFLIRRCGHDDMHHGLYWIAQTLAMLREMNATRC